MTTFASPSPITGGGDGVSPRDVNGHLLLVKPTELLPNFKTVNGVSDAIRCDVADLTTGMLHEDTLWFSKLLVSSLRNNIGQMVLAAMAQGQPKPGQSPPWILQDAAGDANAVNTAQAWLAQNPSFDPSRPAFQGPTTPTQPVYQQPAPAYQPPPVNPASI